MLLSRALCSLALGSTAFGSLLPHWAHLRLRDAVDTWLTSEATVSVSRIIANIGSTGEYAASAASGIIIASPSTSSPDCMSLFDD